MFKIVKLFNNRRKSNQPVLDDSTASILRRIELLETDNRYLHLLLIEKEKRIEILESLLRKQQ